ncbi:hypothetical protein EK21DRAFT_113703 [Setomelanomma holmii]|uniref:Ketopantoate reductase N-terminal domain-containing protein n=1 Tax=Setomelanomma holmii TaxID=210430 RepID=A0A9P4H7J4_9PLEO|nr:hypothetical protein EK21DRAFT_113703 [Setomelanomma holmii]
MSTISKPKVLIVGCGAVGLTQGYHLSFGASITFLVRPGRKPAFQPPKKLYDYKTNALNVFNDYRVIESPKEVAGEDFLFVFDTLDGHTARSEGGVATLKAVANLIRDHQQTFVVYDAVGLDMEDHYATTMGIPKDRLLLAASMLAHQPTKSISLPPNADAGLVSHADMFYASWGDTNGLNVFNTQPKHVKTLGEIYSKHDKIRIGVLPAFMSSAGLMVGILQVVSWSADGSQSFEHFRQNTELWNLMLAAQSEILNLPRFGWTGWLSSWVMGSWATAKIVTAPVEAVKPLAYHEFNDFHHGAKVNKQDIMVIEQLIADGERSKHKMVACREMCRRAEAKAAEKAGSS